MKKILKSDLFKYTAIIFPVFVGILIYNYFTPMYADDYSYVYSYSTGERITNIFEIFPSMYSHYFSMNGRLVLHFIAQFLLMTGENMTNIINSIAFIILGLLAYFHAFLSFKKVKCLPLIFVYFSMFMFTPAFGQSYLWTTGAANYLYGPLILLVFLLPYRLLIDKTDKISFRKTIGFSFVVFVLGLLVGNTNENTAVTAVFISFSYTIYRIIQYKRVQIWAVLGLIGSMVSTCFNLFSPGTHNRLGDEKINFFPVKNLILYTFKLLETFAPLFLILLILLIIYISGYRKSNNILRGKGDTKNILLEMKMEIFYLLVFLASYFSLIVVSTPLRVLSGPLIYLTILILCIYKKSISYISDIKIVSKFAIIGITIIFAGSYMNNLTPMKILYHQYQNRMHLISEAKKQGENSVKLPTIYCTSKYSCFGYEGDLSEDSSSWENAGIAHYFGFEEVVLDNENLEDYF